MFKAIEDEVLGIYESCVDDIRQNWEGDLQSFDVQEAAEYVIDYFGDSDGALIALPYICGPNVTSITTINDLVTKHHDKEIWGDYFPDMQHLAQTLVAVEIINTLKGEK